MAVVFVLGAGLAVLSAGLLIALRPSWLVRHVLQPLLPSIVFCGDGRRRELAITIDDGPTQAEDPQLADSLTLLELLRSLELPATFFLIGENLRSDRGTFLKAALADGHRIGNHMACDRISALLPPHLFDQEVRATERELLRWGNRDVASRRWFRPGGGWVHPRMLKRIRAIGYRVVLGSIWPWDTFHLPLAFQRWFLLANAHPGGVVVLHDRPDTIVTTLRLLQAVVPELRRRGYRFVDLEQLLRPEGTEA